MHFYRKNHLPIHFQGKKKLLWIFIIKMRFYCKNHFKVKPGFEYLNRKYRNWYKISENLVIGNRDNIDWNYSSNILDVNEMWEE